jgi:hypothetical protein
MAAPAIRRRQSTDFGFPIFDRRDAVTDAVITGIADFALRQRVACGPRIARRQLRDFARHEAG